ncbi:hypothetical protein A2331_06055 [Candidatus Falkowbacteria bacterium RIFOXYB2_FULL_34_18]|uniref:ABC transporter domain-containing protein n=1 Tax=Candidatus Falkowbacteria bacterium RIFOXYD2_FULL_34_120 TaxID=1798007 RepID=A0A1F5TPV8_9BACT|nr:MAG: hypothetical protein A2331_06055 [Candidatus Falkowbacteria bacterium RIFOXYB2_FULL_34_18]OGF28995.1 MAG: hypothetical protein A2500_01870 [Candidatus Falkowbacteria bacterium RIFOXYC12_FULL_34_55]OGF35885.1 MAG: hypothetical protein A2466_02270 [Candidatus Falkowbacteria bacterium RIFOXYC2_FULL_34_220]OGF38482.1 MAG: hypothetical protein A2515_03055 [Candidatus Falkowbacteria bacterium RIFOXYD12_FULL_34_57]OGF40561.1 MAG: hypothetical protein A2531_03460 [Candidatus Falkowbacteria bact
MTKIIEIKNLSKKYNINNKAGYITIRDFFSEFISNPIGLIKEGFNKKNNDFWALKNISFSVNRGDIVGVIGVNGAGKSTLLKILSKITQPTEGRISIRGRVASLLEIGTGFHPELTGRENIYLNGTILGMTKERIEEKFNQIVQFSGIDKFLDVPVKRYSSGMYVRLAFSVAAHVDPDILLIDEVLAVGDYEFQKKCLGKMDEVTKNNSRTIMFVSHNMEAIQSLCNKCILLEGGEIKEFGKTDVVVDKYLNYKENYFIKESIADNRHIKGFKNIFVDQVYFTNLENKECAEFCIKERFNINLRIKNNSGKNNKINFFILICDSGGRVVLSSFQKDLVEDNFFYTENLNEVIIEINPNIFLPGKFYVSAGILDEHNNFEDWVEMVNAFTILKKNKIGKKFDGRLGVVSINLKWKKK